MQALLSPDTFEFFARYLLPGFVFLSARARFVLGERPNPAETLIEALILSLINQLIFLVAFGWFFGAASSPTPTGQLVIEVVALPFATGSLVGWLLVRDVVPSPLRRLFMPFTKPVTLASEHAFARLSQPVFLMIGFEDGREVYGYFGKGSLASGDLANGGIFIERLYSVAEDGTWLEAIPSRSAWIKLSNARSIEFFVAQEGST